MLPRSHYLLVWYVLYESDVGTVNCWRVRPRRTKKNEWYLVAHLFVRRQQHVHTFMQSKGTGKHQVTIRYRKEIRTGGLFGDP